ncbi:MAG: polymorphic outer membrane protein [Geminicoccaceae bacterium]|nr:polymorphic outer membrane protein [Geminicoccaceae bacterium]
MQSFIPRAGRWRLALKLLGFVALGACADEPIAPLDPSALAPKTSALAGEWVTVTVTNTSGGTEVGSLRWAAAQIAGGGGSIWIDTRIAGDTIALDAELQLDTTAYIYGPVEGGITISGKDQHRVISSTGGVLSLSNVTVTKGFADYGSAVSAVALALDNSNVQHNRGPRSAIFVERSLYIGNGTVSGNATGGPAVEYASGAQVHFDHATLAYNSPGPGLGVNGYPSYATKVLLNNTIISNNGSPQQNCSSYFGFVYYGTSISNDWSCGEVGIVVADPLLMPLANNGGPVLTHAFPPQSPARDAGTNCTYDTDARYVYRDTKCDPGAYEFLRTTVTLTIDPTVKRDPTGKALLTGTLECTRADTFRLAVELHQDQKAGKTVVDVHSAADIPVNCTTTPQPWSATMSLMPGEAFQAGAAKAMASTFQTPEWVLPASVARSVKISSRK